MANEPQNGNASPDKAKRTMAQGIVYCIQVVHFTACKMRFILNLLLVALVEASLAPIWPRLATVSVATAVVAVGLVIANFSLNVSELSMRAEQIHRGILALRDEELSKLLKQQRQAAPEPPRQSRPN